MLRHQTAYCIDVLCAGVHLVSWMF